MILPANDRKKVEIACKITSLILKKLAIRLKAGIFKTEFDIYRWLKRETYLVGCKLAFRPVVAMQENAAEIHHKPDSTKLKKGFLVVDFGVKYKDFCSDCTRTFYLGKPSKKEKKLYDLVLNAQETGLKEAKIGAYNSDIDAIVRAVLVDYLFNFIHGTGHGVGKKVHKAPRVSPRSKSLLKNGDIITIEPGIYFKNKFGIRIEDTVFIGKKTKILTNTTKRLVCAKR